MVIADLMSRNVATCKADDRLDAAARLMWDLDIGCVPVVDDRQHVIGIITDRDVCMATYTQGKAPQHIVIREVMARENYSCLPDDNLSEAEEIMRKHRVRRLPVIDLDGRLVGDILADGSLDLDEATLAELDLVLAAVHSHLDMPRAAMTDRIVRAINHPRVHVLAHPSSRLLGKRVPTSVDLSRVISAAASAGVLLEINAQPDRLDLDDVYARAAHDAGAGLVISTDAHHVDELRYLRYGVDLARRAWCEPKHVANTLPLRTLRARLRR